MHLTLLAIFAALGALPFTWWVAVAWAGGERFKTKRAYLWAREPRREKAGRRHRFDIGAKPRKPRTRYEPTEETEEP
jgi:hypothetical protein